MTGLPPVSGLREEDDPVLQQQVAERHLPLAGVLAALEQRLRAGRPRPSGQREGTWVPFRAALAATRMAEAESRRCQAYASADRRRG